MYFKCSKYFEYFDKYLDLNFNSILERVYNILYIETHI